MTEMLETAAADSAGHPMIVPTARRENAQGAPRPEGETAPPPAPRLPEFVRHG